MASPVLQRAATVALATALLVVGIVPGFRTLNSDFPDYYAAARVALAGPGQAAHFYDWEWFQRRADAIGVHQVVSYVPNPPLCFAPVLPLVAFDVLTAKRAWIAVNLVLLGATVVLLAGISELPVEAVGVLALLCFTPLRANFVLGQMYLLLSFLVVAALSCWQKKQYVASGLLLGFGAAIKLYPILFVFYFVRKRRWSTAAALVVTFVASLAIAAALIGIEPTQTFLFQVLPRAPRGEIVDPFDLTSSSFTALFHRLFVFDAGLNPHPLIASTLLYSLAQPLTIAMILSAGWFCTSRKEGEIVDWALWLAIMLSVSSMPVSYHLCLAIPAVVIAMAEYRDKKWTVIVLFLAYMVVSVPFPRPAGGSLLLLPLQLSRLMAVVAVLGVLVYQRRDWLRGMKNLGAWVAVGAMLAAPGVVSNLRYFSHADPWPRVEQPQAALNAEPAVGSGRLLFTSMTAAGYVVRSADGVISPPMKNSFHPSISHNGDVWFEVFEQRSQIVVLRAGSNQLSHVTVGESPSVSPDENWLAFVRDRHLWLRSLQKATEQPVELPGAEVLEASVSDTQVVFSAEEKGEVSVYRLKLWAGSKPELWIRGARYPAIQVDDTAIAFSQREHGSWHLRVRMLAGGTEKRLTDADCNALTPTWSENALYYASDCDRGPGATDVRRIPLTEALNRGRR